MTVPNLDLLPSDILLSDRAVVWKYETRDNKPTKVPYIAHRTQQRAAVDDPKTWSPFSVAVDAVIDGKADGVGIVLGGGLVGIDLDHCRNLETGAIDPFAQSLVDGLNSYTEVSPSGTGLHIWVRGEFAVKGRRRQGIEIYSTARYFTVTGHHLPGTPREIHDRSAQVAAFHARIFGPAPIRRVAAAASSSSLTDAELVIKASTATNNATFQALMAGDLSAYNGDDSAADLALCNLLAFWSQRDPDQMDRLFRQSKLFRPKWDSRRADSTYGRQTIDKAIRDCIDAYQPAVEIEIDDTTEESAPPTVEPISVQAWPQLHDDALVGPFGAFVHMVGPHTEADPVALLGQSLVLFSNMLGRSAYVAVGSDRHYLNNNVLLVGETSNARKGQALAETLAPMALIDENWAASCVTTGLSTGEGLIEAVRDETEKNEPMKVRGQVLGHQTVITDPGVADKRLAVIEEEFGRTLRVSRREFNTLTAVIRQAWDHGNLRVMTRHNPVKATGAHISIVAHITPLELRKELKTVDMASGFINRFLLLLVKRSQCLPEGGTVDTAIRAALIHRFQAAMTFAQTVTLLTRDADARAHWRRIYPTLTRTRAGLIGAVCNRAPAHVLRLSCIYALADSSAEIRLEHQRAALALWNYAEASVAKIFGTKTGHRLADYLLTELRQRPNGLSRTAIRDLFNRNRHADEIDEALTFLVDFGLARCAPMVTKGRPAMQWYARNDTT